MRSALHACEIVIRVEQRLVDAGAVTERRQLAGLSMSEVDLLVKREAGWG